MRRGPGLRRAVGGVLLTLAAAVTASMLTPASAATDNLDGGLVFFGEGYSEPTQYVDGFNALAGRTATTIASTRDHACVVDTLGDAECWGFGGARIGSGGRDARYSPPARVRLDAVGGPRLSAIDAGDTHTCVVSRAGRAFCWGSANQGRLGDGRTTGTTAVPVKVSIEHLPTDLRWSDITTGDSHTCALDDEGHPYCWGRSDEGQLGARTTSDAAVPERVKDGDLDGQPLVGIDAGALHTCAVDADGRVYCWGEGKFGRLGMGDGRNRAVPRLVPGTGPDAKRVVDVSAGLNHTCAVTAGQRVFCWGWNYHHQVSTVTERRVLEPNLVEGVTAVNVSAGSLHTCAVTEAGAAWCWGENRYGQIGDGTRGDAQQPTPVLTSGVLAGRQLTAVQAGEDGTVAIDADGEVFSWSGAPRGVEVTPNVLEAAELSTVDGAGYGLCVTDATDAAAAAARIMCPGSAYARFQVVDVSDVGATLDVSTASTGNEFACVLDESGEAYCWGYNYDGQLGIGPTPELRFDTPQPVDTSGVLDSVTLKQVSAGRAHTCVLSVGGTAYCWGQGDAGVLGTGSKTDSKVPVAVVSDGALDAVTLTSIDAGNDHTCAVSDDARLFCWGSQPGRGNLLEPAEVDLSALRAGEDVASVEAGQAFTCLLTDAGRAYCWGKNSLGQVGSGSDAERVLTPTAVDTSGVLDGVRIAELAISSDWSTAVCARSAGGRVFCWGGGYWGMLGNGSYRDSNVPVRVIGTGALADRRVVDIGATYYGMWLVTEPAL